ncbi:MAG: hypothetical protein AAGA48_35420 [Myxococcota bacterium]
MGETRAGNEDDAVRLRVGLRQWVLGLDKAALIVVDGWIKHQLDELSRRPRRPMVRLPDADDALSFTGENFLTIASRVRLYINRLPKSYLLVLQRWLAASMREHDDD